jgi:hypothetical protein
MTKEDIPMLKHPVLHFQGDDAEADRLRRLALFRPESLMALKIANGADHIRKRGYRTDLADRKYGYS